MIAEEVEVTEASCCAFGACASTEPRGGGGALATPGTCGTTGSATVGLSGGFEEVDGLVAFGGWACWCCRRAGGWLCNGGGRGSTCSATCVSSSLSLLLLNVLGNPLGAVSDLS